ncbi:MAG: YkgJ family cysteine cluster protein [Myxococcaceae bacterium]
MALCLRCGLCCDGTIFREAPLTDDERSRLGDRIEPSPNGARLPCRALQADRCCSIYAERPATCRRYSCSVLRAMEAGRITEQQAEEAIDEVVALRAAFLDALGDRRGTRSPGVALQALRDGELGEPTPQTLEALERLGRAIAMLQL